jgi:hypothetical protein
MINLGRRVLSLASTGLVAAALITPIAIQAQEQRLHADQRAVVEHWTPARRAAAMPRDLVIDAQGRGYLRRSDGSLEPYGKSRAAQLRGVPVPQARPPGAGGGGGGGGGDGGSDTTGPVISAMLPADGAVIGASQLFSAVVTDASGIKSVSFVITYPDGSTTQAFTPGFTGSDTWSITLQGFSDGNWNWHVVAKDKAGKGGNTSTSPSVGFTVDTGGGSTGGGSGGGYVTTNAPWTSGGAVQSAAGRIYFEMPSNPKWRRWAGYVCSGTVATDGTGGRSVIITAAHCVYDDANKAFARNVLFIPDQDGTSGSGTDLNCSNDPYGCWVPSFGVVDANWTNRTFPDNIPWDYAYYVVSDDGAHSGTATLSASLEESVGSLPVSFSAPQVDDGVPAADSVDFTHALGYSYSDDPNFMFCAEDMTTEGDANWWLPSCELSGGSSGGPWVQPMDPDTGAGPVISVNSWGYTNSPGMAGPLLVGTSAQCLLGWAVVTDFAAIPSAQGEAGLAIDPQNCP